MLFRTLLEQVGGYFGLFMVCSTSGLVFPLPEDVPLRYAGYLLASGELRWVPTLMVGVAGVGLRDVIAWLAGRTLGASLLDARWFRRLVPSRSIDNATRMVRDHGAGAVLAGRFIPGLRAPVFLVAGASGVRLSAFVFWDMLGLVVAVPGVIVLGFVFGEPILDYAFWLAKVLRSTWAVVLVGAMLLLMWRSRQQRARSS